MKTEACFIIFPVLYSSFTAQNCLLSFKERSVKGGSNKKLLEKMEVMKMLTN